MAIQPTRRPFRAELSKLKEAGIDPAAPSVTVLDDAAAEARHREVIEAIHKLRQDLEKQESVGVSVVEEYKKEVHEALTLKHQLEELSEAIDATKVEIAKLHPLNRNADRIAAMTDELDAIVNATEGATEVILTASEVIEEKANSLRMHAHDDGDHASIDEISEQIMKIFEACNFQDLTGQRITRVVNTLRFIEERVEAMISALGGEKELEKVEVKVEVDTSDKRLLHGPQEGENRISQDQIDALFD